MKITNNVRLLVALIGIVGSTLPAGAQHEQHARPAAAASTVVSGRIVCQDGLPLAQAVVQAWHVAGSERHLLAGVLTDEAGRFAFRVGAGSYVVGVSYIGHAPREAAVAVGAAPVALGDLHLDLQAIDVEGVTITAAREEVRLRSGSTVVDAAAGPTAGGTVADVLRTVPGLVLDGDGRLSMRGSAGVRVLLNGRPTPLEGDALTAFLKQMPASALERIEAGTTVPSSEDAEGGAGVVNLVFRTAETSGRSLRSVAASVGTEDHYLASGSVSEPLGDAAQWDASYSFSSMRPRTEQWTLRSFADGAGSASLSEQASDARARHRLHSLGGGVSARLTSSLSAGLRGSFAYMEGIFRNRTEAHATIADAETHASTRSALDHAIPSATGALSLEWADAARSRRVSVDARAGGANEQFRGEYRGADGALFLVRDMEARQREYGLRADARLPIGSLELDVGVARTMRHMDAAYDVAHDSASGTGFGYDNVIGAGYASLRGTLAKVRIRAGARVERDATSVTGRPDRSSWRLFPSIEASWTPDEGGRVRYRAAYGRRIDRPDFAELNPYSMGEDDMNSMVGNPALRPEVSDQIELGAEFHGESSVVQLTPFLRTTRDPVRPLKAVTESGLATTTPHNLERATAYGVDGSVRMRFADRVTATLSGNLARIATDGPDYTNSGVSVTTRAHVDLQLTERGTLQLYAYRRGPQAIEQGEILPATTTELAWSQRVGDDDDGRLTLRVSDPFRTDELAFRVREPGFEQESTRRVSRPLVSLFLSWAIGGEPDHEALGGTESAPTIF